MDGIIGQRAPLGALLAGTVEGIIEAQRALDVDARARLTEIVETPQGDIVLPPLWITISDAEVTVELAATTTRIGPARDGRVRLDARLPNPATSSLFGQTASTGVTISMRLGPAEQGTAMAPPPGPALPGG
ncbi:MAG: hypothetical protein ACK4TG_06110 [Thermaurantiacus sp.]